MKLLLALAVCAMSLAGCKTLVDPDHEYPCSHPGVLRSFGTGDCIEGYECQSDNNGRARCVTTQAALAERNARRECGECTDSQVCYHYVLDYKSVGVCRENCEFGAPPDESSCSGEEVCKRLAVVAAGSVCLPHCEDDDGCNVGRCDVTTGQCGCSDDSQCTAPYVCDESQQHCTMPCAADLDCGCGSTCEDGACSAGCADDDDCCGDSVCSAGVCTQPTSGSVQAGEACGTQKHCADGYECMLWARWAACIDERDCVGGEECPEGTACAEFSLEVGTYRAGSGDAQTRCLNTCTTDNDCEPTSYCGPARLSASLVCLPRCGSDANCSTGACDAESGRCECAGDMDCASLGEAATCDAATKQCSCTPIDCAGRICGSDGCGGICGTPIVSVACEGDPSRACGENAYCGEVGCRCNPGFTSHTCDGLPCSGGGCEWGNYICKPD